MAREYFAAYHSYRKAIEPLTDAEKGRLFAALLEYSETGAAPELRGSERYVYPLMKSQIDRDAKQYESRCEINRKNGALRGQAKPSERFQTLPNDSERQQTPPKEKAKEKTKAKEKAKENGDCADTPRRFTKPTVVEIRAYCRERGNGIDPQRFFDFYEAKGWRVGNQPMKDWQAAVRTWEGRDAPKQSAQPGNYPKKGAKPRIGQHDYTDEQLDHLLTDLDGPALEAEEGSG